MKNLVISLKTAIERRQHIQQQFTEQSISFEFFDALTPDSAKLLAIEMGLKIQDEYLSPCELACFMSHVSIWKKIVEEKIPYLAIFEDDIYLGENAHLFLQQESWMQSDWNILKIEAFADKVFVAKQPTTLGFGERNVIQLKSRNLGTAGYILSQKGAKAYLDYVFSRQLIALDEFMFDHFLQQGSLNIYQLTPALCIQEMKLFPEKKMQLPSDLLLERKNRMKKYKKRGFAKVQLELLRIFKQLGMTLFGKSVPFK